MRQEWNIWYSRLVIGQVHAYRMVSPHNIRDVGHGNTNVSRQENLTFRAQSRKPPYIKSTWWCLYLHPSYFQRICNAEYVEDLTDMRYQVSLTLNGSGNRAQKLTYKSETSEILTCFWNRQCCEWRITGTVASRWYVCGVLTLSLPAI